MLPPNILITNFCNQSCSFCFARKEMKNQNIKKEMDLKDFIKIIKKLKKNKEIKVIKLLGGEPTLHSKFKEIINLSLDYFPHIQIFTNGIFSNTLLNFLKQKGKKISYTFNLSTPGFILNKKINSLVTKRILQLSKVSKITLSFTFDPNTNLQIFFKTINKEIFKKISSFRLGISNPIAKEKNFYKFKDFPKIGKKLIGIIKWIRSKNKKVEISLNCGFTRCMFNSEEFKLIKKECVFLGFSCFGKSASFDLQTDLSAFHCFSLSTIDKINTNNQSFNQLNKFFLKKRFLYWAEISQKICLKCPFYGFEKEKCPCPCLGFVIK